MGCVLIDPSGGVLQSNDFFSRLVGLDNASKSPWDEWFECAARERDLPTSHRILAHAEGEYRTRVNWALPPRFTVAVDLTYFALDAGNGALYGPLLAIILPVRDAQNEQQLHRMLESMRQMQMRQMKALSQAALVPLGEATESLRGLEQKWGAMDRQERYAELTSLVGAIESAQRILRDCPVTALGGNSAETNGT